MTSPSAGLEDRNEPEDVFDFQEGPEMVSFFFPDFKKNSIKIISRGRVTLLGNITLFLISVRISSFCFSWLLILVQEVNRNGE